MLVLFGEGPGGPDLLLIERSKGLRLHAGQAAFPGGTIDAEDEGPVAAALREAAEEVGVDPAGVDVIGTLPERSSRRPGSGPFRCSHGGASRRGTGFAGDPLRREMVTKAVARFPMGRPPSADEVAAVAVFLASDDAAQVTGQTISANGGLSFGGW